MNKRVSGEATEGGGPPMTAPTAPQEGYTPVARGLISSGKVHGPPPDADAGRKKKKRITGR